MPAKKDPIESVIKKNPMVEKLYPKMRASVYKFLEEAKTLDAFIFCGLRTFEEQNKLYAKGRTAPGQIVTNANGGMSYHNYGLSVDVVFQDSKGWTWNSTKWAKLGALGEKYGLEWGGRWKTFSDKPHFQMVYKQPISKLLDIYNKNKSLPAVWKYLDGLA